MSSNSQSAPDTLFLAVPAEVVALGRRRYEVLALMERILAINPSDNHGFRGLVINGLLRKG